MASRAPILRDGTVVLHLALILLLLPAGLLAASEPPIPAYQGYVTDTAGVLGTWGGQTEELCRDIERKTTAEVAVLTVRSTAPLPAQEYAQKVFDRWKIGKKGKDNGVLVLVAVDDRKMWIATGYGVEGVLPDGKAGEIRDRIILPLFRGGKYGEGVYRGVEEIGTVLGGGRGPPPGPPSVSDESLFVIVLIILFLLFVFSLVLRIYKIGSSLWGGSGGHTSSGWGFGGGGFGGGGFGGFGGGFSGGGGAGGGW
ncbi:MAG: TPM domain-containing protein [Candidatus Deferrimicrobiaceae bacterium]